MTDAKLNHEGTIKLFTERLMLRKFMISDANDMFNNWACDEEVSRYTLWRTNESIYETKEFLRDWCMRYNSNQYYHWAIVYEENKQVIGSISISSINNYLKTCNVGYTLSKSYWNMGIATEALKCVIDFMINIVGIERIYAYHDINNVASGRVMQKCGMNFIKRKTKLFLNSNKYMVECDYYCYRKS